MTRSKKARQMAILPHIILLVGLSLMAALAGQAGRSTAAGPNLAPTPGLALGPKAAEAAPPFVYYFAAVYGPLAPPLAFTAGVASGDITPHSAVLWTRVDRAARLMLQVSTRPNFAPAPQFTRTIDVGPASDFTAKLTLRGLQPGQRYYFRWRYNSHTLSPTGQFQTPPAETEAASVRFAFSGDSDGTLVDGRPAYNQFETLAAARQDSLDFFAYLGDTIYADSQHRRNGPASTLAEFRDAYKLNRQYQALRELMTMTPVLAGWDDHEVRNDYSGQTVNRALYKNGRQAFLEYMPINTAGLPADLACAGSPLFRHFRWGKDVDIILLDERSCRSASAASQCLDANDAPDPAPTLPALSRVRLGLPATPPPGCREAIDDPARTLLGPKQKALFKEAMRSSSARFKFILNEVPIQQLYLAPYDRWEGYAAERQEILDFIRDQSIENVVFLTTDMHANMMNEVWVDFFTAPAPIAYEVIVGPIATNTFAHSIVQWLGPGALQQANTLFDMLAVDCRHLDSTGYGVVTYDAVAGKTTITLKNQVGAIIQDQGAAGGQCTRTFGP